MESFKLRIKYNEVREEEIYNLLASMSNTREES